MTNKLVRKNKTNKTYIIYITCKKVKSNKKFSTKYDKGII